VAKNVLHGKEGKQQNPRTDGSSQFVQFTHFSVKELLTSNRLATSSGYLAPTTMMIELEHVDDSVHSRSSHH